MAIAHVCVQCGWDVSRVRPQREPHYGLNLVRCPKCDATSVRRKHPLRVGWRTFRRIDFALTLIFLRVVGIVSLTFFSVVGSMFALVLWTEPGPMNPHSIDEARLAVAILYIGLPLVLGTFLSFAFAHFPRWKVWMGWLLWMGFVLLIFSVHGPIDSQFDPRYGLLDEGRIFTHLWLGFTHIMLPMWLASAAMLVMALPGIVIGALLLRLRDTMMRAKWRWRRKRLRLAGSANV